MGRSVTVSITDHDGNVNTYTISSDYNFLVVYTHYTFITPSGTEAVEDFACIYSGNTSIPFTISSQGENAEQGETTLWLDQKNNVTQLYYGIHDPDEAMEALSNSGFDHVFTGNTYEDGYQYVGIYDVLSQLPDDLNGGGSGDGEAGGGDNGDTGGEAGGGDNGDTGGGGGGDSEDGGGSGGNTGGTGGGDTTNRTGLTRSLALSAYWLGRRIAGQRKKAAYKIEVLFDGESVTDTEIAALGYTTSPIPISRGTLKTGDVIRITIDGVSEKNTVKEKPDNTNVKYIGNIGLLYSEFDDTGEDYYLYSAPVISGLYLRNIGTYQVKIERMVVN